MMKLGLLSNINSDSISRRLQRNYRIYSPYGYDTWIGEALSVDSQLYRENLEACLVLLNEYGSIDILAAEKAIVAMAGRLPYCKIYVSNFEVLFNTISSLKNSIHAYKQKLQWHSILEKLIDSYSNIYFFDTHTLIKLYGMDQMYSSKMWYLAGTPYSAFGEKKIVAALENILKAQETARKKCLILDLDNTLWGGIVGEEGVHGITLSQKGEGSRYRDFQAVIAGIKETGVLLAIVSKNNEKDAQLAFSHPDMLLKWDDFTIRKVNWDSKSKNIQEIAQELNIDLNSMVFIDDNPVERAEVSIKLSQVSVPDFPQDTCLLPSFGKSVYEKYFLILDLSLEDREKHSRYVANKIRNEVKANFDNHEDYLKSLNMELSLRLAQIKDLGRIHQMMHKTNQFNLTTQRYDEAYLAKIIESQEWLVLVGSLKDDFGDNGLTLLLICKIQDSEAEIDTFLMSCRIMGRTVEYGALMYLEALLKNKNVQQINASYIPSGKNILVHRFYESVGYDLIQENENEKKQYTFNLSIERKDPLVCHAMIV